METIKKIDIHAHAVLHPQYAPIYHGNGARFPGGEDMIELYDKVNIERGVLLPIVSPEHQTTIMTNEGCMAIVDRHPDRFVWPTLTTSSSSLPTALGTSTGLQAWR